MTHNDYRQQLPDYALNLLSPEQLGLIEHHIAQCGSCRQLLLREKRIGQLVRSTINVVSQPDSARLSDLMPELPQKRKVHWNQIGWQKRFAPAMLIIFLVLAVFLTQKTMPSGSLPAFVSTAHAATATSTNTPTATAVQALSEKQIGTGPANTQIEFSKPSIPVPLNSPQRPAATPDPLPTPVASVMQLLVQ